MVCTIGLERTLRRAAEITARDGKGIRVLTLLRWAPRKGKK